MIQHALMGSARANSTLVRDDAVTLSGRNGQALHAHWL